MGCTSEKKSGEETAREEDSQSISAFNKGNRAQLPSHRHENLYLYFNQKWQYDLGAEREQKERERDKLKDIRKNKVKTMNTQILK